MNEQLTIDQVLAIIKDKPAEQVKEMLIEYFGDGTHNNFDGWDEDKKPVLYEVMDDMALYLQRFRN
jgi:hypothetical protein